MGSEQDYPLCLRGPSLHGFALLPAVPLRKAIVREFFKEFLNQMIIRVKIIPDPKRMRKKFVQSEMLYFFLGFYSKNG
jgi:hypothetical protein